MTKIRSTNGSRVQDNRAATARATAEARKRAAVRDIKSRSASAQNKPSNPGLYPKPVPGPKATVSPPGAPGRAKKAPSYRRTSPR